MASICFHTSVSFPPIHNSPKSSSVRPFFTILHKSKPFSQSILKSWSSGIRPTNSAASSTVRDGEEARKPSEEAMSIGNLHRFFNLNLGKWNGSFCQFDADGRLLHKVNTKLAVSTYGEDELMSLIQTLYIKQPPSSTSISGYGDEEEEEEE